MLTALLIDDYDQLNTLFNHCSLTYFPMCEYHSLLYSNKLVNKNCGNYHRVSICLYFLYVPKYTVKKTYAEFINSAGKLLIRS